MFSMAFNDGASLLVLALLLLAASNLQLGIANPDTLAKGGDAKKGLTALKQSGIGSGAMLPYETVAPAPEAAMVARTTSRASLRRDQRARGRYRPTLVRAATQVTA
jgi:uncharacterized membrane protein YdfJ with MMPL/SSD domain